ncbi:MAG: hypothetical protein COC19_06305 [SAR86 cluster bacterium]|uniref:SMP-30/Gluconolactonase/LRE-like region domain-containing protein n=1 Tax=SAR86 cluster bacterium TaxID=2030880 RepID=A0A2A4MKE9_9GAMM|nr:MAG: hypothetical protein COC19_06305 [SAR86 cluster bacterium]
MLASSLAITHSLLSPSFAQVNPNAKVQTLAPLANSDSPILNPYGLVIGPDGGLYFCEVDTGLIRRFDLTTGRLETIAGDGKKAYAGDGLTAMLASFSAPHEIRFDAQGNLFVVERDSHVVRRIDARSQLVSSVAGTGEAGFNGDNILANTAQLRRPHSIAFDADGNLLICDIANSRVRRIGATGIITTLVGTGERSNTPDTGSMPETPLMGPRSIATDNSGNAYLVLREGNAIYQLDIAQQRLQRIAGTSQQGYSGDGGLAGLATFNGPKGIAYSQADHSLYIVDTENHVIRRHNLNTDIIDTVLGNGERGDGPDGDPRQCKLNRPHGVFIHEGIIYVSDSENNKIRVISGIIT